MLPSCSYIDPTSAKQKSFPNCKNALQAKLKWDMKFLYFWLETFWGLNNSNISVGKE